MNSAQPHTKRTLLLRLTASLVLAVLVATIASAEENDDEDAWTARAVGDAFFRWSSNWTVWYPQWDERRATTGEQKVSLDRVRIGMEADAADDFSVRIALETARDPQGVWRTLPQSAWVRFGQPRSVYATAGLIPTSYIEFLNRAWGFRFIEKSAYELWAWRRAPLVAQPVVTEQDVELRLMTMPIEGARETDLGAAIGGRLPTGHVEGRIGVYGGEGPEPRETDGGKAVDARLSLYPFESVDKLRELSFTGFTHIEKINPREEETLERYSALVHYHGLKASGRSVGVGAEYDRQIYRPHRDSTEEEIIRASIFSIFFHVEMAEGLYLVGRHDHFDPNRKNGASSSGYKDEHTAFILGPVYRPNRHVSLAFDLRLLSQRRELLDDSEDNQIPKPELFSFLQVGIEL